MALAVVAAATLAGCEGGNDDRSVVRVFAAASLTEAFTDLASSFETAHPDTSVRLTFGASSALAAQVTDGAPADVFATADEVSMEAVVDAGNALDPEVFARNRLTILVERGNPREIRGLADLGRDGLVVVLCAPEVPCGRLARRLLEREHVTVRPASLEENVKAVVSKVTLGEADAGIVYATDARAAGAKAESIAVAAAADPDLEAVYPMAITSNARDVEAARAWVDHVRSPQGRRVLASHGFLEP